MPTTAIRVSERGGEADGRLTYPFRPGRTLHTALMAVRGSISANADLSRSLFVRVGEPEEAIDLDLLLNGGARKGDRDRVLALLRAERENLGQLLAEMESGYAEYQRVLPAQDEIPDLAGEFAQLKLELLVQTEIYKILSQQYELAKLEVEGQEPKLQLLELADESVSNTRPSRRNLAIISFVVSLGIAILVTQVRLSIKRHMEERPVSDS